MCSLLIALMLLGMNSYRKMGLEFLPKMETPYITIVTVYPGASPTEIETDVAKRIEDVVVSIDGLKHVTSSCMENACQTLLEFELEIDIDEAANDVREKIDLVINDFPSDVERPKVLKFDINAKPIITLALTGDLSIEELYDYADNTLRDRISVLQGVADVRLTGGAEREVHVLLFRDKLAGRGLTSMDVVNAIGKGIKIIPSGRVRQNGTEYSVKFDAEYKSVSGIGELEIANERGSRCYLKDIGMVKMTTEELRQAAFIDGQPGIGIKVVKKADANAVQVANLVHKTMDEIQTALPGGMELVWISDDAAFIQASADTAAINIAQGVMLTAVVLFLFLYSFRTTLIIAITMPLTIVISLFFMYLLGFTLNTSTLLAIGLSVGILVTNSIVVLESVVSRLTTERDPSQAARLGAADVAVAAFASAGTNVVVLFPISMMGTMVGRFFNPFALTMVTATIVSLFISFTLTPILCSTLLRQDSNDRSESLLTRIEGRWNRIYARLSRGYSSLLWILARRRWVAAGLVAAMLVFLVFTLKLVPSIGFTFVDDIDQGEVFVKLEYPTRYDLRQTIARVKEVEDLLKDLPDLRHVFTTVGKVEGIVGQSSEGVYLAQILLRFNDKTERAESMDAMLTTIRRRLADYPDSIVSVNIPDPVGGQGKPLEMEIAGQDLSILDKAAEKVVKLSWRINGIVDPDSSVRFGKPELRIRPRRAVLSDLGVAVTGLGMALRGNLEGIKAGSYKEGARTYDIRVKFLEEEGKNQVKEFLFPAAPGHPITLANIAHVEETLAPVQITRKDKSRVSMVYANLGAGMPIGTSIELLGKIIDEKGELPPGYAYRFIGKAEVMKEAQYEFLEAGILAVILTYLVLAAILESFRQPFLILFAVPLALIGFMWALYLTGKPIDMFVLLGGVMLIGIVVNNAILIIGQMKRYLEEGLPRHEAMIRGATDELRPIIMITLAAVFGMLPLAIGQGLGSELRCGIGIASVGGILISGILTLFLLPALYNLLAGNSRDKRRVGDPSG
jgi:HAE1 family hydrophobic/amphiphilic exporter-1